MVETYQKRYPLGKNLALPGKSMSATVDGEATAHFLARRYQASDVKMPRIARSVPEGGELEYMDDTCCIGRWISGWGG